MKKRLRLLAWLITLTMLCELLPFSAFAQSDIAQTLVQRRVSTFSLDEQNDLSSVTFEGGAGTPEDPYQIATAEQLDAIRNNLSASYILLNDIDLSSYGNWVPIGDSSSSGFTGTLDGNGHSIQNMTITSSGLDYSAFIGSALNATVKNLSLENVDIEVSDTHCVAGIIGSAVDNCIIESCSVSGNIRVTTARVELLIGGIAGKIVRTSSSSDPQISNSVNRAAITVDGPNFTTLLSCGGIAGYSNATISNCDNYGEIHSISDNSIFAGGIVGDCSASVISCKNFGTVYGQSNKETYTVAGIAGRASVSYCVNSGSVHGHSQSGFSYGGNATGINGLNSSSARFCYNIATNIDSTYGDDSSLSVAYRIGCGSTRYNCYSLDSTLVNGAVTTEYASTAMVNGESLSYDEILAKIREYFPDFELEPDVPDEPSKEFTFKRDNLSFLNRRKYFFDFNDRLTMEIISDVNKLLPKEHAISTKDYSYRISDNKLKQLISGLSPSLQRSIMDTRLSDWTGSCYGMTIVSMLHYFSPESLPYSELGFSDDTLTYELPAPKDNSEVQDLINYYQLSYDLPSSCILQNTVRAYIEHYFSETLSDIISTLQNGTAIQFTIVDKTKTTPAAHSVVLLDVFSETDDAYSIHIYDPVYEDPQVLLLYKLPTLDGSMHIDYEDYHFVQDYLKGNDLEHLDVRNYFKKSDNECLSNIGMSFVVKDPYSDIKLTVNGKLYYFIKDGQLVDSDPSIKTSYSSDVDASGASKLKLAFSPINTGDSIQLEINPRNEENISNTGILLNNTFLSISSAGAISLSYNETARTIDVTAEDSTDVNLLMTQNNVDKNWPWHSWAIDTTGTTEFHASMDDEGLHLSGDGISNAKYATENMDTDTVDSGSIPADADSVIIISKKDGSNDKTEIKADAPPDPVEPADLTVSVSGGTIIQINDDAFAESLTSHTAKQGDKITIMADTTDKFNDWIVNEGDVTLDDATAPTTTFTMNEKSVRITAEYQNNSTDPTPTPTPGGGASSGGGGGGGGGAAVLIGVGAAAAITAGVVMMSPVEIKGRVVLADQTAVPGAKLSLLREGKVVAQTTADENGNFSLKAKRGSYELTAAYTNADGQLIYKTIDIKAPAKDLTVTF